MQAKQPCFICSRLVNNSVKSTVTTSSKAKENSQHATLACEDLVKANCFFTLPRVNIPENIHPCRLHPPSTRMTGWLNTCPPCIPPLRSSALTGSGQSKAFTHIKSGSWWCFLHHFTPSLQIHHIRSWGSPPSASSLEGLLPSSWCHCLPRRLLWQVELLFFSNCRKGWMRETDFSEMCLSSLQGPVWRVKAWVGVFADGRAAVKLPRPHSWKQDW